MGEQRREIVVVLEILVQVVLKMGEAFTVEERRKDNGVQARSSRSTKQAVVAGTLREMLTRSGVR